jgi:tetratricopeptide (TPR) repeat protein
MDHTYDKALTYYERGNYNAALDYFNKSEDIAVKYEFKKYIANINKYQQLTRALLSESHYKAGFEYFRKNKLEEAVEEYRNALNYNPDNRSAKEEIKKLNKKLAQSYYEEGMSYFARSEMSKARELLKKSLEYEPDKSESQRALNRIK